MSQVRQERKQHAAEVCGVPGTMKEKTVWGVNPALFSSQEWLSESRSIASFGAGGRLTVKASYQDNPRNGRNSFHITGDITTAKSRRMRDSAAFSCLHDEIATVFPELAHLIKWHGVSTNGPTHYVANTVFLAGDKDCHGLKSGDPWVFRHAIQFGDNPVKHTIKNAYFAEFLQTCAVSGYDLEVIQYDHSTGGNDPVFGPKFTYGGYAKAWHECPFDSEQDALDFLIALQNHSPKFLKVPTRFSKGKARELDSARRAAVWPDATDADLMVESEQLKAALLARLPKLLEEFRRDILAAGFLWELS